MAHFYVPNWQLATCKGILMDCQFLTVAAKPTKAGCILDNGVNQIFFLVTATFLTNLYIRAAF